MIERPAPARGGPFSLAVPHKAAGRHDATSPGGGDVDNDYLDAHITIMEVITVNFRPEHMMKTLSAAAIAAAVFAAILPASAVMAETSVRLAAPLAGATLNADQVDMSVYYTRTDDKTFDVVATYVSDAAPDQPQQLFMALSDGYSVHFGLPGHPETLYGFARQGNTVTVSSQAVAVPEPAGA